MVARYGMPMNNNPTDIADHLENEHGIDAALVIVDEGRFDAYENGDNYRLSIWREVGVILRNRASG